MTQLRYATLLRFQPANPNIADPDERRWQMARSECGPGRSLRIWFNGDEESSHAAFG